MRAVALGLLLTANAVAGAAQPIEVTDGIGRRVTLSAPPQRIVALFASNTELLAALGLAPRIVGIEDYTRYPPGIREGRTIVGGRLGFSAEAIARLRPDLVVLTPARGAADVLIRPLTIARVPVVVLTHRDLEQVFANLLLLGRAAGVEAEAQALVAGLRARLTAVRARWAGRAPVRVYVEIGENDRGALQTVREGTYSADAVRHAGGASVFAGLRAITQVSAEAVIRANPDVILVARYKFDPATVANRPGWHAIRAVQHRRIYAVPREMLLIPGPRIVDGVEHMSRLLHAESHSVASDSL